MKFVQHLGAASIVRVPQPEEKTISIRAVAVSAPDWPEGTKHSQALNSRDPASLLNACRYAALAARDGNDAWSDSNWAVDRLTLRQKVLLMYSLDDLPAFERM